MAAPVCALDCRGRLQKEEPTSRADEVRGAARCISQEPKKNNMSLTVNYLVLSGSRLVIWIQWVVGGAVCQTRASQILAMRFLPLGELKLRQITINQFYKNSCFYLLCTCLKNSLFTGFSSVV